MKRILKPTKNKIILLLAMIMFGTGVYILLLTASPQLPFVDSPYEYSDQEVPQAKEDHKDVDYIFIDKLNLLVPINTGNQKALEKGAWHRLPERGDPEQGGNFILSAHRFQMGLTPAGTKRKSPFYNLGKVTVGDELDVHFNGNGYRYKVTKIYTVKPDAVEIEEPSPDRPHLTLYTCTLKGSADGRTVVEAERL